MEHVRKTWRAVGRDARRKWSDHHLSDTTVLACHPGSDRIDRRWNRTGGVQRNPEHTEPSDRIEPLRIGWFAYANSRERRPRRLPDEHAAINLEQSNTVDIVREQRSVRSTGLRDARPHEPHTWSDAVGDHS